MSARIIRLRIGSVGYWLSSITNKVSNTISIVAGRVQQSWHHLLRPYDAILRKARQDILDLGAETKEERVRQLTHFFNKMLVQERFQKGILDHVRNARVILISVECWETQQRGKMNKMGVFGE